MKNKFFLKELNKYQKKIEKEINSFFELKEKEFSNYSIESKQLIQEMKKYSLRPGKRIRPILVLIGFKAIKGKINLKTIKAACTLELLQSYLLIHDDIMDESITRRGKIAFHKIYEQKMIKNKLINPKRFGESTGIIAGDLMHSLAVEILLTSGFNEKILINAVNKLMQINKLTAVGQQLDLILESKTIFSEKDILKVQEFKTAKYTIEGPLLLGAILAGANKKQLKQLSNYAIPIGIAFQIQDDVLGVFGSKKTGKSIASDLIEGKKTLLILKTFEKDSKKHLNDLKFVLGNKKATKNQLEKARKAIIESNALNYSQNLAEKLSIKSINELNKSKFNKKVKQFLTEMNSFLISRMH
jgi:geranylgeranyl diphosphate synthase, type I